MVGRIASNSASVSNCSLFKVVTLATERANSSRFPRSVEVVSQNATLPVAFSANDGADSSMSFAPETISRSASRCRSRTIAIRLPQKSFSSAFEMARCEDVGCTNPETDLDRWRHGEREESAGPVKYYELAMAAILRQAEHSSDCCLLPARVPKTGALYKKG
jgi:hypothetical protein